MQKVLFVIPSLGVGGLERVQITIANKLVQRGYEVTIIVLNNITDMKNELDSRVNLIYKAPKRQLGGKIPYVRHKFYDDGMWETRASAKQLYRHYIGDEKYDVEIAFFRGLPVKIISGSTNREAVHLAWVHSDASRADGFINNFKSIDSVIEAYRSFDKIVCVSKQATSGFKKVFSGLDNIVTIYNMLPVKEIIDKSNEIVPANIKKSSFHIVLVGRLLDSVKGQSRVINSVHRIKQSGADISLTLIGDGKDKEYLNDLICSLDATDYITINNGNSNPYPYIKDADLLVCGSYFEGYNLTVAEALILGVPVLSTDCTGPNEILDYGEYGMIVENSEEGLYNGLKELAYNTGLLDEYRKKALMRIDFFDEEKIFEGITNLF